MNRTRTPAPATWRPSRLQRMADKVLTRLLQRGKGPAFMRLLTVRGRVTGQPHSTPVVPVRDDEQIWLVSPFGEVAWVRNARVAGEVELQRGDERTTYAARQIESRAAVPVLRAYLSMPSERFVRSDFAVTAASPDDAVLDDAPNHPVFVLTP